MRERSSGPIPMPSRCSRFAGVVMLFHSPMSRMNRTLPDAVDGEMRTEDGELAQPPRRHDQRRRPPTHATAAQNGIAGVREPADRQARQRSNRKTTPRLASTSMPSLRDRVARPASRPAATNARPALPAAQGAGAHPQRRDDQRLVEREVVRLDEVDRRQQRDRGQDARRRRRRTSVALASRAMAQVSGAAVAPMSANGAAEAHATVPKSGHERDLDDGRQRHPVGVRGDRQDRRRPGSCHRPRRRSR